MYISDQTLKEKKIRDELAADWNFEMENCKMTKLFTMSHTNVYTIPASFQGM